MVLTFLVGDSYTTNRDAIVLAAFVSKYSYRMYAHYKIHRACHVTSYVILFSNALSLAIYLLDMRLDAFSGPYVFLCA